MRTFRKFLAVVSLLFLSFLLPTESGHSQTSNTWSSVGPMAQTRTGAAAVLLPGGRVLITGGSDGNGVPQASTEIFDPATGGFSVASQMSVARANHAAIVLNTGDVLVTGGLTTGGGYSDTAEIFDSQNGTWTVLQASLGAGLAKHAMAILSDGNVLIVGGESTTGPVGNLLLFKTADGSVMPIGTLMTPRTNAAAASTPDGRVLVAGGMDINGAVLSSTEVFTYSPDTMEGAVAAGPNMTYPRTNASATTTYDGVAIIGGTNGTLDLGSAEIFSQWTNAFRLVNGATPRSGHIAALLPKNGSILAMGGTGGTAVDLLQPWGNNIAGAFISGAASGVDHSGGFVSPVTIGTLLAAGGTGSSAGAAEVYWFPTISTDQPDYAPGTPVVMTGLGFQPGETVKLYLREWVNQMLVDPPDYTVTADGKGSFALSDYAPTPSDLGARYHLTAVGGSSGFQAQTIFTDASTINMSLLFSGSNPGIVSNSLDSSTCTWNGTTASGSGCSFSPANGITITFTAMPGANWSGAPQQWTKVGCASGSTTCSVGPFGNKDGSLTVSFVSSTTQTKESSAIVTYGQTATSTVTVTNTSGSGSPTGSVAMTVSNGGSATCTSLAAATSTTSASTCTIIYPSASTVAYSLTATYSPTGNFSGSNDNSGTLIVNTAPLIAALTAGNKTYDGNATEPNANMSCSLSGVLPADSSKVACTATNGSFANANAGSGITVSATLSISGDAVGNYTLGAAGTSVSSKPATASADITKATATLSVTPYSVTYDGIAHTAVGTAKGLGNVDLSSGFNLSGTTHTNAGTYANDSWSFHDPSGNYADASGTVNNDISKASATIVVTPYSVTYDGQAHTASVTTISGVNGESGNTVGTVDVSHTTHSGASTYSTDYWSFAGSVNYSDISATTITDTINKANAAIVVTPYSLTYDGQSHTAAVTISGVNGETGATVGTVDLSHTAHVGAGTYNSDTWTFTGTANYNDIGATTITDTIAKATASVVVTPYALTYDGDPHSAVATSITGVNGETGGTVGSVDVSNTTHTNAGTYSADTWAFTGTANYNDIPATIITDVINKANANLSITPYTVTYDGNAHIAPGTATGVKGEDLASLLTLTGTTHTDAGDFPTDAWSFAGNNNYNPGSGTVHDRISKADAIITVNPYSVTYDGNPHTATGTATGVKGESFSLDLSGTTHTNANSYNDSWTFTDSTGNYNNASGTVNDVIGKASATITVTPYSVTYDGNAHTASGTAVGVKNENLSGLDLAGTTHTNANHYTDSWTFTDSTGNYNSASGSAYDVISKADAIVNVTPYNVTYDGNAHTAAGTATGVKNEDLSGLLTLSGTTHTNAGDFAADAWSFAGDANYNTAGGTVHDQIGKADANVTVTAYSVTYDGNAHTAVGSVTGAKGESLSGLDLSGTTHTNASTYSDSWTFTDSTGNYKGASGTVNDVIGKANAVVNVTPYNVTYDGKSHMATGSAKGVKGELLGGLDLSSSAHTNASSYTDHWTFTDATGNYNNTAGTVSDEIGKAILNITADNKSMILGAALPSFTVTYAGFVNGELSGVLGGSLNCSTTTNGKTIGSFPISCTGQTSANYSINYNPGTLSVSYLSGGVCYGDAGHQILQPINVNGTSVFNAKSTSPAKFRVCDANGVSIGNPGVVSKFVLYQVFNGTTTNTVNETVDSTTPDAAFRWDPTAQQWIFNIDNKGLSGANRTYSFLITLNDGTTIPFSYGLK